VVEVTLARVRVVCLQAIWLPVVRILIVLLLAARIQIVWLPAVLTQAVLRLHLPTITISPVVRHQVSAAMVKGRSHLHVTTISVERLRDPTTATFARRTRSRIHSSVSSNVPSVSAINETILRKSEV